MRYVVHDKHGAILRVVRCPKIQAAIQAVDGENIIEGSANDETQYVKDGQIIDRPANPAIADKAMIAADDMDTCSITNIPIGSEVSVEGQAYTVNDSEFEFSVDQPGEYQITVTGFPYMPATFTIEAI